MDGVSVKKLARDVGITAERLMHQLRSLGIAVESEVDIVTGTQQLTLLKHLRSIESESPERRLFTIDDVSATTSLNELNQLLTSAMAHRTIQALIKDEKLDRVIDAVLTRSIDVRQQLLAAAMLGRLAAVARGRESTVFGRADEVFTEPPISIESLADGEAKAYAASFLTHTGAQWVAKYSYREAIKIDTADNARRELLAANLERETTLSQWLGEIGTSAALLNDIDNAEARVKRVRRIFAAMRDVAATWQGELGQNVGESLAECFKSFASVRLSEVEAPVLFEALGHLVSLLVRVIEVRFSMALYSSTYALLEQGRKTFGPVLWRGFIESSDEVPKVRIALLESALVLARQNRTDRQMMSTLVACFISRTQASAAIRRHFKDAQDLDADVADWWRSGGDTSVTRRSVEHVVGNNEDAQIGALLIEIENNRSAMDKVGRAVVPLLDISEPILASTVKKAVDGYQSMEQIVRRLARMRKLSKTDLRGSPIEYNPLEHEMLGGHKPGVRMVRVVRDGIRKRFGGKDKTLVKPWVEPEEELGEKNAAD